MKPFINTPIPGKPLPSTDRVLLEEDDEAFVDLYAYSEKQIKVNMQYAKASIPSAVQRAYVRKTVAEKLIAAKSLLPKGFTFEVLDAWRPYGVQLSLFQDYCKRIVAGATTEMTREEVMKKASEFVSVPDKGKKLSYVHATGGAVDVTILDAQGNRLNMGTDFDEFSPKAYTAWYEQAGADPQIRSNRRLLHNVLCQCGFTNYPAEWWHYDLGDSFWAFYTGNKAVYSSKYEEADVKDYD